MKFRSSVALLVAYLLLLFNGVARGGDLPFGATIGTAGVFKGEKVKKGKPFGFTFCLHAFETNINSIEMTINLPAEIEELKGETSWKGFLDPNHEHCLRISMKSRTEMEQWNQPIHANMQFMHKGMDFTRDVNWSQKGFEDTGFVLIKKGSFVK